ncbi:60S ribosomal protein L23a [Sciurus carolinensis]|uniref:60S ribosomal protein L23a n=1 Tax=Sciurus carolinensis TaxID=30640 RepID=A0AA41MWQ0_SCICA|nr:60S ribosomal protein L23a [Sciurus carolinensis]
MRAGSFHGTIQDGGLEDDCISCHFRTQDSRRGGIERLGLKLSHGPKTISLLRQPKYQKSTLRRNKLDLCTMLEIPLTTKCAMKKAEDDKILVFIMVAKTKKHQVRQGVKKLCDIDVAKVIALIRPDGEKKAYVQLSPLQMLPEKLELTKLSPTG